MGQYQFSVTISDDSMEAHFSTNRSDSVTDGYDLNREDILDFLKENHVVAGVRDEIIQLILRQGHAREERIAEATEPQPGNPTTFETLVPEEMFSYEQFASPSILELDVYEFPDYTIPTVPPNTPILKKIPPTIGEPGRNVRGDELKPGLKGQTRNFPKFKNAVVSPDDNTILISTTEGHPFVTDHYVAVEPVHIVENDVVTDVKFDGIVMLKGSIKDQVRLFASSDVIILGATEAVVVESGRNVIVSGGVKGKDQAVIKSQGDIIARFVEMSTIECGGNVHALGIIQSFVISLGHIYADRVIGGEVRGTGLVEARMIGSPGVDTGVNAGENPYLEEKIETIQKEIVEKKAELNGIMKQVSTLIFQEKRSNDDQELIDLRAKIPVMEFNIQKLHDLEETLQGYQNETPEATVRCHETAHSGTIIVFGDEDYFVDIEEVNSAYILLKSGVARHSKATDEDDDSEDEELTEEE